MKQLSTSSIVVFGEALVDEFPEQKILGGAPFNVARTLALFNCSPLLISRVGQDQEGKLIRNEMQRCGMLEAGLQIDPLHPTGRVLVHQDEHADTASHRFEILPDQAYDYIEEASAQQAASSFSMNAFFLAETPRMMYFGSLAQRSPASKSTLNALLTNRATLKYLDLNLRDGQVLDTTIDESLRLANIVKLNEDELFYLLKLYGSDLAHPHLDLAVDRKTWQPSMRAIMKLFDLQAIIVTLGARGYAYFDTQDNYFSADGSSNSIQIVDTVGGGDAFSAVFLTGLYKGWPLQATLRRAHEFATAVCGIRGAVTADFHFYQSWMQRWATEQQSKEA